MASKTSRLTDFQQYVSNKFPGKNAKADWQKEAELYLFGGQDFSSQIPPGSQIISQGSGTISYKDPQGYTHNKYIQIVDGSPKVKETTDRPNILPDTAGQQQIKDLYQQINPVLEQFSKGIMSGANDPGIQDYLNQITDISNRLQNTNGLANLDPETQAYLDQISAAEQAKLKQQFDEEQGKVIAQLFGNRVQQSSIAGQNTGQMLQRQGLVTQQQQADAANRALNTRQTLTQNNLANLTTALQALNAATGGKLDAFNAKTNADIAQLGQALGLLTNLTGQQTQRDIAEGGYNIDLTKLAEMQRQFDLENENARKALDVQIRNSNKSGIGQALKGLASGALAGFSAIPGLGTIGKVAGAVGGSI